MDHASSRHATVRSRTPSTRSSTRTPQGQRRRHLGGPPYQEADVVPPPTSPAVTPAPTNPAPPVTMTFMALVDRERGWVAPSRHGPTSPGAPGVPTGPGGATYLQRGWLVGGVTPHTRWESHDTPTHRRPGRGRPRPHDAHDRRARPARRAGGHRLHAGLLAAPPQRRRARRPRRRPALHDLGRPLPARRRDRAAPRPRDPHHARLRREQGGRQPDRDRPGLRPRGLRRAVLLRPRVRRVRLQDPPRRPRVGRPRGPPAGQRPGRQADLHLVRHRARRPRPLRRAGATAATPAWG